MPPEFVTLPPLPYAPDALAPVISAETIGFHHGKHHAAYVNNLGRLLGESSTSYSSLEDVILQAPPGPLFNNAAQAWNHTFYWHSMAPGGGGDPTGPLADALAGAFGSVDAFTSRFADAARTLFGSGWVWLAAGADGSLEVLPTKDADLPLEHGLRALIVIDVWEHAYYIDHRNDRARYVDGWLEHLANWEFAAANYAATHTA